MNNKETTQSSNPCEAAFSVDPSRMSHGPVEGDIVGSYSADVIAFGKPIRKPFSWLGSQYVTVSIAGTVASAYRLVPIKFASIALTTYSGKTSSHEVSEKARNDPNGFYHGITIQHGGQSFVMNGPAIRFEPRDAAQSSVLESLLFDGPAQGTLF